MPFVYLDMVDSKDNLTEKHIRTIMHVHANYMNDFDWYISTNDDTYIVMENLKLFVQDKCPNERKLYGKVMRYGLTHVTDNGKEFHNDTNSQGFVQGGTGFVASREAIRQFAEAMKNDSKFCVNGNGWYEDQEISACYRKVGVYPGETRDGENRERFLMYGFAE